MIYISNYKENSHKKFHVWYTYKTFGKVRSYLLTTPEFDGNYTMRASSFIDKDLPLELLVNVTAPNIVELIRRLP